MWVVVILAMIADVFEAGVVPIACLTLAFLWLPVAVLFVLRRRLRHLVVWRYRQDPAPLLGDRDQIRRSRRLVGVALTLLLLRVPFYVVFLPSLHWLNQVAHEEYAIKPMDSPRAQMVCPRYRVIGLMPVMWFHVDFGGVTFNTGLGFMTYKETYDDKHWWEFPSWRDFFWSL
jgi:hypothetical protein